jgi:hypothetical protein
MLVKHNEDDLGDKEMVLLYVVAGSLALSAINHSLTICYYNKKANMLQSRLRYDLYYNFIKKCTETPECSKD